MSTANRRLLVGQSGGPTAVLNASLAGVVAEAQRTGLYRDILGMPNGVEGVLAGRHPVELDVLGDTALSVLARSPAAALGSCRYKLKDGDAERLATFCRDQDIDTFVYIGGNDSADTSRQVLEAAQSIGFDLAVVGVPKTIDNDLVETDHCPGYGSAARFVAQTTRESALDTQAMRATDPIKIVEVMGRYAGWLAGAAWLARASDGDAPHLVYVPERPVSVDRMLSDVDDIMRTVGWCVVVLCENQPDTDGRVLGASGEPRWVDAFGHAYYDSPAQFLSQTLQQSLRVRARFDKPGTIQRSSTAYVSVVDRDEAELVGRAAVRAAVSGHTGVMTTLVRRPAPAYAVSTGEAPLRVVANAQRLRPPDFVNADGNGMTAAFEEYAQPLLGRPLPRLLRF